MSHIWTTGMDRQDASTSSRAEQVRRRARNRDRRVPSTIPPDLIEQMPIHHHGPAAQPSVLPLASVGGGGLSLLFLLFGVPLFVWSDNPWHFGAVWAMASGWALLAWACAVRTRPRIGLGEVEEDAMPTIKMGSRLAAATLLIQCTAVLAAPWLVVLWDRLHWARPW